MNPVSQVHVTKKKQDKELKAKYKDMHYLEDDLVQCVNAFFRHLTLKGKGYHLLLCRSFTCTFIINSVEYYPLGLLA